MKQPDGNNAHTLGLDITYVYKYLRMISLLCSGAQAVWDSLKRGPSRPKQPVKSNTATEQSLAQLDSEKGDVQHREQQLCR